VGSYIFADGNHGMEDVVGHMLTAKNLTISVAESCTGGMIGHRLTNVPGSSLYFQGGVVVYSDQSKTKLLSVRKETLEKYGAVSDKTVREMACGVRKYIKTDLGLAVTGIAGPDGGTKEKPVGSVHIGLATKDDTYSEKYRFWGNREQVKSNTSMMALDWIRRWLNGDPFLPGI
jgi:nicotinamide-nucleotide amidase